MGHIYAIRTQEADEALSLLPTWPDGSVGYVHTMPGSGRSPLLQAYWAKNRSYALSTDVASILDWVAEGFVNKGAIPNCYVDEQSSANTSPMFELVCPGTGDFLYSSDWPEVVHAVSKLGYNNLGTVAYVHQSPTPGTFLLERFRLFDSELYVNPIGVGGDKWFAPQWKYFVDSFLDTARILRSFGIRLIVNAPTFVPSAEGSQFTSVTTEDEYHSLLEAWSATSPGVNVFGVNAVPHNAAGFSVIKGSCNHIGPSSGLVVVKHATGLGQIIAHELGHYLGIAHRMVSLNLMNVNYDYGGEQLDEDQIASIKLHCQVRGL